MDRNRSLIRYWRNSLADADLRSPEVKESSVFRPRLEEILAGRLSEELTREIFRAAGADRQRRRGRPGEREEELPRASLLLAPFGLRRLFRHGTAAERESRRYNPVWVPAFLDRDGALQRGEPGSPWIGREFLEPVTRDQPVVGRLDVFDRFLTEAPRPAGPRWEDVIAHAEAMVEAVVGRTIQHLELPGFEVLPPLALLWSEDRGIGQAILDLYDKTLKRETIPPLLRTLAAGASPTPAPSPHDLTGSSPALRHLGQMGRFSLSRSQRQTAHSLLTLPEGAVLAVNGPPGTGKTTVLQSIVATLWVEAALAEKAVPPIILACSTNNQAVTNILDSFGAAASLQAGDPWTERWLPGLTSYGLFLPSFGRFNDPESTRFQKAVPGRPGWLGLPEVMENPDFVRQAEAEYLAKARAALGDAGLETLEIAAQRLKALLAESCQTLAEWIVDAREIEALRHRHECSSYGAAIARIRREREEASAARADQESLHAEVLAALQAVPFWEDLLSFLPAIRERRNRRLALPFLRRHQQPPAVAGTDLARALPARLQSALDEIRARLELAEGWGQREDRLAARLAETGSRPLDDLGEVLDLLDPLRYRLFLIAGRYGEARWLMEMKSLLGSGRSLPAQSRAACERRFRRFAMLTPCMVATFYQAPKAFDYWDRDTEASMPLFETIDLLIVDEAGQVSPEVGAATFALAKRALVVGDVHQIEPVWSIPPIVDSANLREVGIEPPGEEAGEDGWAFRASRGSLMSVARRATALTCEHDRGLFLSEHRRCVPEVIRFCNELVYQGRLRPLRPTKADRVLPALGWAHVTSPAAADGGSRSNPGEARVIADWLARHRPDLEEHYGRPLKEIVAVITPFAAQRVSLEGAFREQKLKVQAGTVHTFQGAERPVVLFSAVYSFSGAPRSLFFDAGPNMLNVAVSRAKDSFLIFGDMRIFDPFKVSLPSGKLARLAFEAEDGEITDVESAQHLREKPEIQRISKLEEHRQILREALAESTERVLIVSPYLTHGAMMADDIPAGVRAASERGVQVCVVYSRDLNHQPALAAQAADILSKAGAEVTVATRIHSKTLAVDGSWLVEGSFNWLSAKREVGHRYQYRESSLVYRSPDAHELIRDAWRDAAGKEIPNRTAASTGGARITPWRN
jgi:hypothetical protein